MATPQTVTVVGTITNPDGSPGVGLIRFDQLVELRSGTTPDIIAPGPKVARLDVNGQFTLNVFANNSPNWTPQGWPYRITIGLKAWQRTYDVLIPYQAGPLDLDSLLPMLPPPAEQMYAPIGHTHPGGGGGGAVDSVNGQVGVVVLTAGDVGAATPAQITAAVAPKANTADLAAVAFSGAYSALSGRPTIPATYADLTGTVPPAALPALAVTEYLGPSANQAAMLAKVGQRGDWTTRTDLATTWVLTADNPALLASWQELLTPASPVQSVAGRTGAVVLTKADVGLGNVSNLAPADLPISTATQTALDGKAASGAPAAAVAAHEAAVDPHPQYTTLTEANAAAASAVATHTGAADPHPQYTTAGEAETIAAAEVAEHVAAADPHPQYSEIYVWDDDTSTYVLATAGRIFIGPTDPGTLPDGGLWVNVP